jgi:GNAT superfamily N-acetyltransferase
MDRDALVAAFERLGEESRYRRFLSAMPRLTETQLRFLTDVDQRDHVALAAVDGTDIVGVARFVRLNGSDAELAIAVIDDWQAKGIGTALLAALAERAREQGVTRFVAFMLGRNQPMLRLLAQIGDLHWSAAGAEIQATVDLPTTAPQPARASRARSRTGGWRSGVAAAHPSLL